MVSGWHIIKLIQRYTIIILLQTTRGKGKTTRIYGSKLGRATRCCQTAYHCARFKLYANNSTEIELTIRGRYNSIVYVYLTPKTVIHLTFIFFFSNILRDDLNRSSGRTIPKHPQRYYSHFGVLDFRLLR